MHSVLVPPSGSCLIFALKKEAYTVYRALLSSSGSCLIFALVNSLMRCIFHSTSPCMSSRDNLSARTSCEKYFPARIISTVLNVTELLGTKHMAWTPGFEPRPY